MTVFEKLAPDVDLMAVVVIDETFNGTDVDSVTGTDKSESCQMFRKDQI